MKLIITLLLTFVYSVVADAKEVVLSADKDSVEQLIFQETIPTGGIGGTFEIIEKHGYMTKPTRVVVGLFHGTPRKHALQLVIEQIEESDDNYWLAYEYIKNDEVVFRADIDSDFTQNQKIDFEIIWLEHDRIHLMVNGISHQPYIKLESKTPFISIHSGSAKFNYTFNKSSWPKGRPPIGINNAPIN